MAVKLKKFLGKSVQLTPGSCGFCGQDEDDEERFGKLIHKDNISVHYFCMLFASGLCQNGETEKHGIMGFLLHDILKEIRRASRLRCVYCKKNGATIGCVVTRCRVVFHLPCGLDNGILNQFSGRFCSYCEEHRPRQSTPSSDRLAFHGTAKSVCSICMSSVEARSSNTTLRTPCCKNAWFHKQCLQRHASCSGLHFFRCPLCNNKDIFQDEMLRYGIYIPDQDAAWEREPNAFDELLQRHSQCDSKTCKCPHGRDYSKNDTKWEIMLCDCCGSQGTHLCCGSLKTPMDDWLCTLCSEIIGQVTPKVKSKNKRVEKGKNKKAPVDKDWMEKKLQAMKQPTVPTGRGQKRKHSEIGATPDGGPKKKRAYKKRRSSTQTSTVTSSTPSASVEASHSQPHESESSVGFRTLEWTPEEMSLGYQLRIPVSKLTNKMIRKEKSRLKRQTTKKKTVTDSTEVHVDDNNTDDKLSYAEYVDKYFSSGDARFTSYCDRIMQYQEYLYGPGWAVGSSVGNGEPSSKESSGNTESCSKGESEGSVNEMIASSCDEDELDDQSMSSFLRGLKELNRKMTELRKAHFPLSTDKKDSSTCVTESAFLGREAVSDNREEDEITVTASSEDSQSVINVDSEDDAQQEGTSTAPIVVEESKNEDDDDLIIVSSVVVPKVCTCKKLRMQSNNCRIRQSQKQISSGTIIINSENTVTSANNTASADDVTPNMTCDTVVSKTGHDKFASTIDAGEDILTLVPDPQADSQGDFIKLNPGPDKLPTSPLADTENRKPQDGVLIPAAVPFRVVHGRPEQSHQLFEPGKFYGKYAGSQNQAYYTGQPMGPASPLATVYSNTTLYRDNLHNNSYRIQQVQQVNLTSHLQPIGIAAGPYTWDCHSQGSLNGFSCTSAQRDGDDVAAMSYAYNSPVTVARCGKCCMCKKK